MSSRPVPGSPPVRAEKEPHKEEGVCAPIIKCLYGLLGRGDRMDCTATKPDPSSKSDIISQPAPEPPPSAAPTKSQRKKQNRSSMIPKAPDSPVEMAATKISVFDEEDLHPLQRQRSASVPVPTQADPIPYPQLQGGSFLSLPDLSVLSMSCGNSPTSASVLGFMSAIHAGPISVTNIKDVLRGAIEDNIASDLNSRILLDALPAYIGKALASLPSPPKLDDVTEILFSLSLLRVDCLDEASGSALRGIVQQALVGVSIDSSTSPTILDTLQCLACAVADLNLVDLDNGMSGRDEGLLTTFRGIIAGLFREAQSRKPSPFSIVKANDLYLARVVVAWLDDGCRESSQACAALRGFNHTEWHLTHPSAAASAGVSSQPHEVLLRDVLAAIQEDRQFQKAGNAEKVSRKAPRPCAGYTPDAIFVVPPETVRIKKKLVKIPEITLYIEWDSKRYHAMPSALNGAIPGEVIRDRVFARLTGVEVLHVNQDIWNQATGEANTMAKSALRSSPGTVRRSAHDPERERTMKYAAQCTTIRPMLETLLDTHLSREE